MLYILVKDIVPIVCTTMAYKLNFYAMLGFLYSLFVTLGMQ